MSDVAEKQVALARHYLNVDQPQRVLDVLGAAGVDLDDPEVWALRGEALYELDRYEDAVRAVQQGLALDAEDPTLLDVLALCELERDNLAEAERALLAALAVWPEHATLVCHYALVCARGGQADKANRLVAEAMRLAPESATVLRTRAQVSWLNGDRRRTERDVAALLELEPEDRIGHVLRANTLVEQHNVYGAVRHFEHAARLDPSDRNVTSVTRYNKVLTHWLQWPLYPIQRWGPAKVWLAYLVLVGIAAATKIWWLIAPLVVYYLLLVLYSWTIAPAARWWVRRRMR